MARLPKAPVKGKTQKKETKEPVKRTAAKTKPKVAAAPAPVRESELKIVNPFAVGRGFIEYGIKMGCIVREGKGRSALHFATESGRAGLKKFGIILPAD